MRSERLSLPQARRIGLAAQGFADPRPTGRVDARHVRRALGRVALLQIDSVNVLARSHELPLFARLGPYPRPHLVELIEKRRELFEYWGHAASFIPIAFYPALRWRMDACRRILNDREKRLFEDRPGYVDAVLEEIAARGPITASALSDGGRRRGTWWDWADGKTALEYLFGAGDVLSAGRGPNFERRYDLAERVLPAEIRTRPALSREDAQRTLLLASARAHGVGTATDLADYFRIRITQAKPRLAELVDAGQLLPVQVEGWNEPAYVHPDANTPRRVNARALLSPFDSLIWRRDRTERLFGMHLRIELYTPAAKRKHGYYVLPFLLGEHMVGRVDLKADRQAGVLQVPGAFREPTAATATDGEIAAALRDELTAMAGWLGLDRVEVASRGDLAGPLRRALQQ